MKQAARVSKLEDARRKRNAREVIIVAQCLEPEHAGLWRGTGDRLYTEAELDALAESNVQLVRIAYEPDWRGQEGAQVVTYDDIFAAGVA